MPCWTKPQNNVVREYTVIAWCDENGNGVPDTDEESRQLKVVVFNLILEAPGKTIKLVKKEKDASRNDVEVKSFAAPVMLNDNRDCGLVYGDRTALPAATNYWDCAAKCPDGVTCDHREFEPVWDLNYVGGTYANENDLLKVTLKVEPNIPGKEVALQFKSGNNNVRVWPNADKGNKNTIVKIDPNPSPTNLNPSKYPISALPKDFYVEGINVDMAGTVFEGEIELPNSRKKKKDLLRVQVVSLLETQDVSGAPVRRVINSKGSIKFEVKGGSDFGNRFSWQESNATPWQPPPPTGNNNSRTFNYSGLPENNDHVHYRRFESTVTASIHDGENPPNTILQLQRKVRVALNTYPGTPMPTTPNPDTGVPEPSTAALLTLYNWNTNPPQVAIPPKTTFDDAPDPPSASWIAPNDKTQGYYRLFVDPEYLGAGYAMEWTNGRAGDAMRVYFVRVAPRCWTDNLSIHVFGIYIDHEIRHLEQDVKIRDDSTTLEFEIDQFFKRRVPGSLPPEYFAGFKNEPDGLSFFELDAYYETHISNLASDFRLLHRVFANFLNHYTVLDRVRRGDMTSKNAILARKVKIFLQGIYLGIPYPEMKRYQDMGGVPRYVVNPIFRAPQ